MKSTRIQLKNRFRMRDDLTMKNDYVLVLQRTKFLSNIIEQPMNVFTLTKHNKINNHSSF